MRRFRLKENHGALLKNTAMLAILQLSTYVLALVVVPYQTRVLGPEVYGILGAATAVMVYFQLIIDFGFLLSSTEDVASHRDDKDYLRRLLTAVTICKICLAVVSGVILLVLCQVIGAWEGRTGLFLLFYLSTVCTSLMPDYMYRGLEKMTAITVRTVAIRTFFTVCIFVFLRRPEDLFVVPVLNIIGNGIAMVLAYVDLARRLRIRFTKVGVGDIFANLKRSSVFFISRIATTAYTSLNTIILDLITAGGGATGYYTASDKLITTGRNVLSPISDSLYPYMARNRDFKMVRKVLTIAMPPIILFCAACFIWAEPLCKLFFGPEYGPAGAILRAMLPVGVVTLPNYVLGFPTLGAMGLSKYANYSVVFGSALHICNLLVLYLTGNMNMITLAILVSVAECAILAFRIVVIVRNRHLMRPVEESDHG